MKKIFYFDEDSALDYIILKDGGKKVSETITNLNGNLEGKISAELGEILDNDSQNKVLSFIKKAILNSNFGIGTKIDGDMNKTYTSTLNNTVLTDYIKKAKRDNKIKKFNNINIEIYPNSMAYYRLYTPYMELIDSSKSNLEIDLKNFEKVLNNVKGYIELTTKANEHELEVLRFNNLTFRGNYKLSDILKMNLDVYAVKVGNIDKSKLDLNNELKTTETELTAEKILNQTKNSNNLIPVYDVVLAGVTDE